MTLETWVYGWGALIFGACLVTAVSGLREFWKSRKLWRWPPLFAAIIVGWWGWMFLYFSVLGYGTIPIEWWRPSLFALVVIVLALLIGHPRNDN